MRRPQRPRYFPGGKIKRRLPDGIGNSRLQQRGVHQLSLSRFQGVDISAQNAVSRQCPGRYIGYRHPHFRRRAARKAGNAHQPAHPLRHQVKPAPLRVWPGAAKPRYAAIDQRRFQLPQLPIAQPQPRHHPRPKILHHHIGPCRQPAKNRLPPLVPQVQRQTPLVPIQRQKPRRRPAGGQTRPHPPRIIPALRLLNLDNIRPHIRQQHRADRPRHYLRQIQRHHPIQRTLPRHHTFPPFQTNFPPV